MSMGAEAGGGGSALTLAFGFEIDFDRGLGGAEGALSSRDEREDEGGVGKTSSGGIFSPKVRVSLAIFFRRASRSLSGLSASIGVELWENAGERGVGGKGRITFFCAVDREDVIGTERRRRSRG